ncbi:MAG: hypothetical protein AVDCRST_MAG18-5176, partial [uncultured Thermomicrobiales bacterium]
CALHPRFYTASIRWVSCWLDLTTPPGNVQARGTTPYPVHHWNDGQPAAPSHSLVVSMAPLVPSQSN